MTGISRWPALLVLCAGSLMIILDGSIVAVALPAIQADLGFTATGLAWVVNAYLVAFGGLLLLAGRLGDLLGRRQVFLVGVGLFGLASLLCALAAGPATLVTARFAQGVGGALTTAVSLGMIVRLFPEAGERARAIAVFSFTGAAGASLGLLAGGVLTDLAGWRSIFLINLPIGALIVAGTLRLVPTDRGAGRTAGLDLLGAALATTGLMATALAIVGAGEHGWTAPPHARRRAPDRPAHGPPTAPARRGRTRPGHRPRRPPRPLTAIAAGPVFAGRRGSPRSVRESASASSTSRVGAGRGAAAHDALGRLPT